MKFDNFLKRAGLQNISFESNDRSRKTMSDVLDDLTKPIDVRISEIEIEIDDLKNQLEEAETPNVEMSIKTLINQKKYALKTLSTVVTQCNQ